jgi:predicted nucleic acid-binding protein
VKGRVYIDSSAYVSLLLGEETAGEIERRIDSVELLSSVLLILEVMRTLVRLSRAGTVSAARFQQAMDRVQADLQVIRLRHLSLELCRGLLFPAVSLPRSSDLAHLRTALSFHADSPLTTFLTLDKGQLRAAAELGLPT